MTAPSWSWALLVAVLGGGKLPELPTFTEARRHVAHDEPASLDERAELLADESVSTAEVALLLGVSRQRVHALRRALHPRGGLNPCSLEPSEPSAVSIFHKRPEKDRCQ